MEVKYMRRIAGRFPDYPQSTVPGASMKLEG